MCGGSGGSSGGGSLSDSETEVINAYTRDSDKINRALFGGQEASTKTREQIGKLDRILDKSVVANKEELYRGIQEKHFDKMVADLKPGDTFTYSGFMSTTRDQKLARTFSDWKGSQDLLVKVTVKPGAKALHIKGKSGDYMDKREIGKEILVGRGQKFVYKGMTQTSDAKILNIEYAG